MPTFSQKLQAMIETKKESAGALNAEVLGQIPADHETLQPGPQSVSSQWATSDGAIALEEGPPPWELEDQHFTLSDARRFLDCPQDIVLRWVNPRLVEQTGWEYWRPVSVNDSRFKLKVDAMLCVDGTVRRDGSKGDILAYMPRHWVESRRKQFRERTQLLTQSAIDRQEEVKDDFRRGKYGPYVHLEEAKHPTHTMFEGRSVTDA